MKNKQKPLSSVDYKRLVIKIGKKIAADALYDILSDMITMDDVFGGA